MSLTGREDHGNALLCSVFQQREVSEVCRRHLEEWDAEVVHQEVDALLVPAARRQVDAFLLSVPATPSKLKGYPNQTQFWWFAKVNSVIKFWV